MSQISVNSSLALREPLPLTLHPVAVYLRNLSPGSRPTMRQSLNMIASLLTNGECDADTLNWAALTYQHTVAVQGTLLEINSPTTVKKKMAALRRVLAEARKLKLMDAQSYEAAIDLPPIKSSTKVRGRALTQGEITALIEACHRDSSVLGARDAALIGILRGGGLRRAEVVKLRLKDFNQETGEVQVIDGKGGKDRTVYLPQAAICFVKDWLEVRGSEPGALLCPVRKGGQIELRHMTPQAVLFIVQKRATEAGVKSFSPHDFRRTFCSDLLDAGVDIVTVQKLAGHSSPMTTARYDRRGEEVKRQAVQKLQF